MSLYIYIQI